MVKLRRLVIHRFRQVKPGTTLEFADGFNLILGRNGTGKTTLLELLGAVWTSNYSMFANERLHIEGVFEGNGRTLRIAAENLDSADPKFGEDPDSSGADWRVRLVEEGGEGPSREVELTSGNPVDLRSLGLSVVLSERHAKLQQHVIGWLLLEALATRFQCLPPRDSGQQGPARFDEALRWLDHAREACTFRWIRGEAFPPAMLSSRTLIPDSAVGGMVDALRITSYKELVVKVAAEALMFPTGASRHLEMQAIVTAFKLNSEYELKGRSEEPSAYEAVFGWEEAWFTRRDGVRLRLDQLSFGQRRLFAVFWYLSLMPEAVFIDELANGLHHDWIEAAMVAIGERQAFLATQHPFIMDFLPSFESAEDVRRSIVRCRSVVEEGQEVWLWENLPAEETEEVYQALEVGITSLNEVLRARGLW